MISVNNVIFFIRTITIQSDFDATLQQQLIHK